MPKSNFDDLLETTSMAILKKVANNETVEDFEKDLLKLYVIRNKSKSNALKDISAYGKEILKIINEIFPNE